MSVGESESASESGRVSASECGCLQGKPTNPHLHAGAYMSAYQKWPIGLRCLG